MTTIVYISSDGSMMTYDDVLQMLKYFSNTKEYEKWDFDQITGRSSEFTSREEYSRLKKIFQKTEK